MRARVLIKTELSLDALAIELRRILNIPDENRSPDPLAQRRNSTNKGGWYYFFEVLGFEIDLAANAGEAEFADPEWDFGLFIDCKLRRSEDFRIPLTEHFVEFLCDNGIVAAPYRY